MTRETTNFMRYFIDNLLPIALRDNKYFMYPMFYLWFKGKNVNRLMEFKNNLENITDEEYTDYYKIYESLGTGKRPSDLNNKSIDFLFEHLENDQDKKILDVGCGNGYILSLLKKEGYQNLTGCDIIKEIEDEDINFVQGEITKLPFDDDEFDIVMCNHVIEHIIDSSRAIEELKRICKGKLILTTPKQRYFKYTFDLHVNFYPEKMNLLALMNYDNYVCEELGGDWSFVGYQ